MGTREILNPILSNINLQIHLKAIQTHIMSHPIYPQNLLPAKLAVTNHTRDNLVLSEQVRQEYGDVGGGGEAEH